VAINLHKKACKAIWGTNQQSQTSVVRHLRCEKRIFAPFVSAQNHKTKCKFARPRLGAIFAQNRLLNIALISFLNPMRIYFWLALR